MVVGGKAEGLGTSADCTSIVGGDRSQTVGLGPACHSETARRERKLDWAGERNTDFLKAVVGTLSPFKCRVGWGSYQKDLFPHPKLEAKPLGPEEGEGDAGGRG